MRNYHLSILVTNQENSKSKNLTEKVMFQFRNLYPHVTELTLSTSVCSFTMTWDRIGLTGYTTLSLTVCCTGLFVVFSGNNIYVCVHVIKLSILYHKNSFGRRRKHRR